MKMTKLSRGLLLAFGGGVLLAALPALAQQNTQRIEITGSAIKRTDTETALPVQTLNADDIKRTGLTSVADLVQALPAMQGYLTASNSVNGGGGGVTTASLHGVGARYTLVLLNGRRVAPYSSGAAVNLNSLPLSAIERVEILTDGASALYGSDAIAGVVNFITRKDSTEGVVSASGDLTEQSGGGSFTASVTKGFGDLTKDRFNVLLSLSYEQKKALEAKSREFSKTGILRFMDEGAEQEIALVSSNNVPGNARGVQLTLKDGSTTSINFSPYLAKNGSCPAGQYQAGTQCFFDYSATVQTVPASKQLSFYSSARFQATNTLSLFGELMLSRFDTTPRYAPPAQPGISLPASILASSVQPYLAGLGYEGATATSGTVNLRLFDAGGRQDRYRTDTRHVVIGSDFSLGNWDSTVYFTRSENDLSDKAISGYSSLKAFNALMASGKFDPLMATAGTAVSTLAPIVLNQVIDRSKSAIDVLSARTSTTLGKLPGGAIGLGLGADVMRQTFRNDPSPILMGANALQPTFDDAILGGAGGVLPFNSTRRSSGLFGELSLPLLKSLEATLAARYDSYGAVSNSRNFDSTGKPIGAATQGQESSSTTYKLGLRFQPMKDLLLRASVGTGFKVPNMGEITRPLQAFGNTGFRSCPPGLSAAKAALCAPIAQEYNIQDGGNPASDGSALKPEKSTQWTIGFRYEPVQALSLGADLWTVQLRDQIGTVTEGTAFSDGKKYENLFKVAPDPITGTPTLTFLSVPINTGKAKYQGVDVDIESKLNLGIGRLTTRFTTTYMIKADYQQPGDPGYVNSLQKIGPDGTLVSRYILRLQSNLKTGDLSHTATIVYRPGYADDTLNYTRANGTARRVDSYTTVDWQTRYDYSKALTLTFGIKNLFDAAPPFSVIDQSGTGNVRGIDPRYSDPVGRRIFLSGNYKF